MRIATNFFVTWGPSFKQFSFTPSLGISRTPGVLSIFLTWLIFDSSVFFIFKKKRKMKAKS